MWPTADVKLSGGPHGMPASAVRRVQRDRLLRATTAVVARKGFASATVRDLLSESGLSRRTYYDLYEDKEEAYLDAFASIADQIDARVGAALAGDGSTAERVTAAIEALTEFCAAEPEAACAVLVEGLAAGQSGRAARAELIERLADRLAPSLDALRPGAPDPSLTARATVGGIFELLYGPLARRDAERLRALADEITALPLLPVAAR